MLLFLILVQKMAAAAHLAAVAPPDYVWSVSMNCLHKDSVHMRDTFFIVLGDFNHVNLKTVLPKFYQHINFAIRENNTLDKAYTNSKGAYKAYPLPHLGTSNHISIMLAPAYRPRVTLVKPVRKRISVARGEHPNSIGLHGNRLLSTSSETSSSAQMM